MTEKQALEYLGTHGLAAAIVYGDYGDTVKDRGARRKKLADAITIACRALRERLKEQ